MIRKVLVANRGEIACRIMRTCADMGIATVGVFSDVDAGALHVRAAGEAVRLSGTGAGAYLDMGALLEAARRTGADAVHPGYGFLAENASFASACGDAGITFIGPTPEVIRAMGSKRQAKEVMAKAGVPVVPGYQGEDQTDRRFRKEADALGYPVMIKASAGGGGKGMRLVTGQGALLGALAAARREAMAAFGDDSLILEKFIEHAVGSAKNPMTDAQLEAKFAGLAEGILPPDRARRVMDLCWKVEALPDAAQLARSAAT